MGELQAAVFERIYRDDFPAGEMDRIKASFIAGWQRMATDYSSIH